MDGAMREPSGILGIVYVLTIVVSWVHTGVKFTKLYTFCVLYLNGCTQTTALWNSVLVKQNRAMNCSKNI